MNATTENNKTRNVKYHKKIKSIFYDETGHNDLITSGREKFKIDTCLVILDRLLNELNKRRAAYQFFFSFAFIVMLESLSHDGIVKGIYYDDMDLNELINECLHLKAHIIQLCKLGGKLISAYGRQKP